MQGEPPAAPTPQARLFGYSPFPGGRQQRLLYAGHQSFLALVTHWSKQQTITKQLRTWLQDMAATQCGFPPASPAPRLPGAEDPLTQRMRRTAKAWPWLPEEAKDCQGLVMAPRGGEGLPRPGRGSLGDEEAGREGSPSLADPREAQLSRPGHPGAQALPEGGEPSLPVFQLQGEFGDSASVDLQRLHLQCGLQ